MPRAFRIPDPRLAMAGVQQMLTSLPAQRRVSNRAKTTRGPLTDVYSTFNKEISGGFAASLTIPNNTIIGANDDAWFGLIDIPAEEIGQDVMLFSWVAEQVSTEYNGTLPVKPWGSTQGSTRGDGSAAALVVGDGTLPITGKLGTWISGPCAIPSIHATPNPVTNEQGRYIDWVTFPVGGYADAIPFKRVLPRSWSPFVYKFPTGTRLQLAMVVRGTQINNVSGIEHTLRGIASGKLQVGLTSALSAFTAAA